MTALEAADLFRLTEAVTTAAALDAADSLGVLAVLEAGPAGPTTVAATCRITDRGAAVLLYALDVLGLVERVDDTRSSGAGPAQDRQPSGESERPATAEAEAAFCARPHIAALVGGLARAARLRDEIRDGRSRHEADTGAGAAALYPMVVGSLAALMRQPAARVAKWLPHPAGDVLDVGAGAAPWSIALATADPSCHVTALDLPEVLAVTRQAVANASLQARFRFLPGDMLTAPLEPRFDLVVLGNICHLFDAAANQTLLRRLSRALRPGGAVAIVDILPAQDPQARRSVSLYALGLLGRTASGGVHGEDAYRTWLAEAGFGSTTVRRTGDHPPMSLITAEAR
jgi:ubiquinone/menaquinone biosynthesis C-methylase UbiE